MEDILNEIISLEHEIENSNKDKLWRFNFGFFNENDKLKFVTPFLSIKLQDEGKLNIRYPEWKKACVVLTHDIDLPVHSLLNLIKLLSIKVKKVRKPNDNVIVKIIVINIFFLIKSSIMR